MNLQNALNVIHVLCEKNHCYNDAMRESLLGGIYDVADACIRTIQEFEFRHRKKAESEIELIKDAQKKGYNCVIFRLLFGRLRLPP